MINGNLEKTDWDIILDVILTSRVTTTDIKTAVNHFLTGLTDQESIDLLNQLKHNQGEFNKFLTNWTEFIKNKHQL